MHPTRVHNPVLVTGASGFVGACAVRRLLDEGFEVHVLLRPEARLWRLQGLGTGLQVHSVNLLYGPAVTRAVAAIRPATILHLAAHGAYESQADAVRILQTNILGTYYLLDAARAAGVRLFVNAGSSSEYGYKNAPMTESDRLDPNSVYAVSKAAQTHLCSLLAGKGTTALATFRLFSVYGPWEEPTRLMPTVIRRARAGLPLHMVGPDIARDFVYVDDVLDALLRFDRLGDCQGEVFNLGTGVQATLRDVTAAVEEAVDRPVEVHWGAMAPRRWDSTCWQADCSRARQVLDWVPRYSLREGIRRMAAWMKEEGDDCGVR